MAEARVNWSRDPWPETKHRYSATCSSCGEVEERKSEYFFVPTVRFKLFAGWSFNVSPFCPRCCELLAEQGTLQRLLDLTPQDAVIDRPSLDARLHEVNAKLNAGLGYKEGAMTMPENEKTKLLVVGLEGGVK